ncbi:MAG: hypothetical protein IPP73_05995 [Chitinophagaceae bacterium]|nr:hypothetical protein [Chitinophagaceae bacterium]
MMNTLIRFVSSLSFLYLFTILLLLVYGLFYYRRFVRGGNQPRHFPWVFLSAGIACLGFLYVNFHAPLSLHSVSNLDHHFIRHEGFRVNSSIELGRTDTVNFPGKTYNHFTFSRKADQLEINSAYAEEPFYVNTGNKYQIASVNYPANGHSISLKTDTLQVRCVAENDSVFVLTVNGQSFRSSGKNIRKASSAWMLFRDETTFINSPFYTSDRLMAALKQVYLLRDHVTREEAGPLKYFLSSKLFQLASSVAVDGQPKTKADAAFKVTVADQAKLAWGIGFLDNNRNQFRVSFTGEHEFNLLNQYPVSYPLTAENREQWEPHTVQKFLVSDEKDLVGMPGVFTEGFMFSAFPGDASVDFAPLLLSYQLGPAGQSPAWKASSLGQPLTAVQTGKDQLLLPALSGNFQWYFTIRDSFQWQLGSRIVPPAQWQMMIFGSLLFFIILVFGGSLVKPSRQLSWIWQLLSVVTLVLLTTRFFLYWRYKSFPPYEGLDLPSLQQLNSFWNFGVVILAALFMGLVFGFGFLKYTWISIRKKTASIFHRHYQSPNPESGIPEIDKISERIEGRMSRSAAGSRNIFFGAWILVLITGGAVAAISHFEPSTCRHLAIGLMIAYFLFSFISYKFSPLVKPADQSWWNISTGKISDIIISNPVKLLLSISLLGLFAFVDIGFAIVFLNFLLFNEAFLCINYAFAGLSAGSDRNARYFGAAGLIYTLLFIFNLLAGPYLFRYLLTMPELLYMMAYAGFALMMAYLVTRLMHRQRGLRKTLGGLATAIGLFMAAFLFFPKQRILDKASLTRYRIDVMTMPVDQVIETAYQEGKTYEPVIRAAQNQWFINTFIDVKNNPAVNQAGFHLLPHAPQNKGARYNAQATDLVTSRFFIAEHGKWSVLLYVLLLMLPGALLASFYKLYPDFTNRINGNYPVITLGFSLLNYLLMTALLVILAATGRYIFFGQDLPFGSILSKQSILFPAFILLAAVWLFKKIPLEHYPNRKKILPGAVVFTGLAFLLVFVNPVYNKDKEFRVADLAKDMDNFIQARLQPVMDYFDTSRSSRRLPMGAKDRLFSDSVRILLNTESMTDAGRFFRHEMEAYSRSGFSRHLDANRLLYLDLHAGHPQLAVNDNYFRVEPPPHLQQYWTGNVLGDTVNYNLTAWQTNTGKWQTLRIEESDSGQVKNLADHFQLVYRPATALTASGAILINNNAPAVLTAADGKQRSLKIHDSIFLTNPGHWVISDSLTGEWMISASPDAFMKNYYVNGSRFYVYPMGSDFIWARNFAESVAPEYTARGQMHEHVFLSLDAVLMDSLHQRMAVMMKTDTAYKKGAEYAISIADGNGRLIALPDFISGLDRPDPNDKATFNKALQGENGLISQSLLRKEIGNINMLRLNPGPGSTLKPIVFSAIASQLKMDWDAFAAEGFSVKQQYYGGEKVAEYDFEKNNGRISKVTDYIRYSDNYYHSNLLLLGSYPRQPIQQLLASFTQQNPEGGFHWPRFSYQGHEYWLNGFENWPGYRNGETHFGDDSSFISVGLVNNYGIDTRDSKKGFDRFCTAYDSLLFRDACRNSGYLLPEFALFDQTGLGIDHHKPNEVFMSCFRGHVKGSSQVMIPPVKMLDAFGKLVSQNRNYTLTLNPWAAPVPMNPFKVDESISYNDYLSIVRENIFEGMEQALYSGTAARLGSLLKGGSPYFYYVKTGTTGDDEKNAKSKLFVIVISKKDISDPSYNFRKNKFFTIYFTSQNGPAKQNEEFQRSIIRLVESSSVFKKYMNGE